MNFKTAMKNTGRDISAGINRIKSYFSGKEYEEDLDSIIEALYAHTNERPSFNFSSDFKERIKQKKEFLVNQAAKLIFAGALSGAWGAVQSGNVGMIGEYILVGASGAVLIIVVTTGSVIVKRVLGKTEMNFDKAAKAIELFRNPKKFF